MQKAKLVAGCDVDQRSLRQHATVQGLVASDLEALPFRDESVTLITCNMVVEHLDRPLRVFREFARILSPGGRVIVHTPNACSHFAIAARLIPDTIKRKLARALDGRDEADVFPIRYRANTRHKLRCLMASSGLAEETCSMLASEAALQRMHPLLVGLELLYIRLTLRPAFSWLRFSILASFRKSRGDYV